MENAVSRAAAQLIAPKGDNALGFRVGLLRLHADGRASGVAFHGLSIHLQLCFNAPILRASALYGVGLLLRAGLCFFKALQMREFAKKAAKTPALRYLTAS